MIDVDKPSTKRKVLAVLILSFPALCFAYVEGKFNGIDIFTTLFVAAKTILGFSIVVLLAAGVLSAAFILIYFIVILLARILLGKSAIDRSDDSLLALSGLGYVAFGIVLAGIYYGIFSGLIHV